MSLPYIDISEELQSLWDSERKIQALYQATSNFEAWRGNSGEEVSLRHSAESIAQGLGISPEALYS